MASDSESGVPVVTREHRELAISAANPAWPLTTSHIEWVNTGKNPANVAAERFAEILASRDVAAEARGAKAERERYKPFLCACLRLSNMLEGFVMGNVDDGELEAARLEVEAEADKLSCG